MKPLSIFLIRHGESLGNVNKAVYKTVPDWKINLTERGVLQAHEAGRILANTIKAENSALNNNQIAFYCSPWYRARQTYDNISISLKNSYPDIKITYKEDPRIREQEWGNYQEDHLFKKINEERKKFGTFFYRMPNGESGADVYDRVTTFIDTLHRDFEKEGSASNICIVSHGLAIKAFIMRWFHLSVEEFDQMETPDNCCIIQMRLQLNHKYKLQTGLKTNL